MEKRTIYVLISIVVIMCSLLTVRFLTQKTDISVDISSTVIGYDAEYRDSLFPGLSEEEIQLELNHLDDEIHQMTSKEEIEEYIKQQPQGIFIVVHYKDEGD